MESFFVDPETMTWCQLSWAFVSYFYVLYIASNLISDGSELLCLVPEIAGLVGSIVLPILGAVPDGFMVFFSGMDPDLETAQKKLQVGIGSQAGSTIMVLTIPLFCAILGGRVDIDDHPSKGRVCNYHPAKGQPKNAKGLSLFGSGVQPGGHDISGTSRLLLITSLSYLVIQIPSLMVDHQGGGATTAQEITEQSNFEKPFSLVGLLLCFCQFCFYLRNEYLESKKEDDAEAIQPDETEQEAGLSDSPPPRRPIRHLDSAITQYGLTMYIEEFRKDNNFGNSETSNTALLKNTKFSKQMRHILQEFYKKYKDQANGIDKPGFKRILDDVSLVCFTEAEVDKLFTDVDGINPPTGYLDFEEFQDLFKKLCAMPPSVRTPQPALDEPCDEGSDDEAEEVEEDMPEDIKSLPADQQKRRLLFRSFWMMGLGTILVLIFSDPMVDVLSAAGEKSGVSSFYIAFILAPLAANASELVASYNYSLRKSPSSIAISFGTCTGAGCMNNTYVLGIFYALLYTQGLAWSFTAETVSILAVEVGIWAIIKFRKMFTVADAFLILSLHPMAMVIVYALEAVGLD